MHFPNKYQLSYTSFLPFHLCLRLALLYQLFFYMIYYGFRIMCTLLIQFTVAVYGLGFSQTADASVSDSDSVSASQQRRSIHSIQFLVF